MQRDENDIALSLWAVTCDALARGEQIFLLVPRAVREIRELPREEFWLLPDWERHDTQALTEPYQDRMRALDDLRHQDGRARLKYYATAEYAEAFGSPHDLRGLDGEHTLNAGAVADLFGGAPGGDGDADGGGPVSLLVLRVYALPEAEVVERRELAPIGGGSRARTGDASPRVGASGAAGGRTGGSGLPRPLARRWTGLPRPASTAGADPVVEDGRFVSLKARLLQRTGAIRAV